MKDSGLKIFRSDSRGFRDTDDSSLGGVSDIDRPSDLGGLGELGREDWTEQEIKITDIRPAVKNENRVNVFVNQKYAFSFDITQVVEFKLKKGLVISKEQLEQYKKASEFGKLYQRVLEWTLARPHSKKEVKDYLSRKVYERSLEKSYIDTIISRLEEKGYINDEKFAEYFIQNRSIRKGVSARKLKMELQKKGVSNEATRAVMSEVGRKDEEEILKIIARKRKKYDNNKLIQYLCRQGFSFELAKEMVERQDENMLY
ncbi:MAG: RecX family transcriptional regulator [Candidatus Saccharibacteria bacterium]|nr:RecX family transcriptional regulator [Candidatus Saccharibacteria bacterium]